MRGCRGETRCQPKPAPKYYFRFSKSQEKGFSKPFCLSFPRRRESTLVNEMDTRLRGSDTILCSISVHLPFIIKLACVVDQKTAS